MKKNLLNQLAAFNQIYKEMDDIYHSYALSQGLSDTALWILYVIWTHDGAYTQREVCAEWSYSPQTINTALKGLEKQGLVELVLASGSRKNKRIYLTSAGRDLAEKSIKPLVEAECNSFAGLSGQESAMLLALMRKYTKILQEETEKMKNKKPEDG